MFQAGAPSHLELFDPKPELTKRDGQLPPAELLKDYRAAFIKPNSALLESTRSSPKRERCTPQSAAAKTASTAKSRSDTASREFLQTPSKPSAFATASLLALLALVTLVLKSLLERHHPELRGGGRATDARC
jgi:hypothetical protein